MPITVIFILLTGVMGLSFDERTQNADSHPNIIPVINTSGLGKILQKAFPQVWNTPNILAIIHIQEYGGEPAFRAYIRGSNSQKEEWASKVKRDSFLFQLGGVGSINSHEAAAATLTIHLQDGIVTNTSLTSSTKSSPTPMTLSITSGMPNNFSEMPQQSTTLNLRREETTTNVKPRLPSVASVWKVNASFLLMLSAVVMLAV